MTSNKRDFDYLFLTKSDNEKQFKLANKVLKAHGEGDCQTLFSEYIQSFSSSLEIKDLIIMSTPTTLYLLDKNLNP